MDTQTLTLISGVALLFVFALVGWRAQRREADERTSDDRDTPSPAERRGRH